MNVTMSSEFNVMVNEIQVLSKVNVEEILDDIVNCAVLSHNAGKLIKWTDYTNMMEAFESFTPQNPTSPLTSSNQVIENVEDSTSLTETNNLISENDSLINVFNKLSTELIDEAMCSINGMTMRNISDFATESYHYLDVISEKTNEDYDESVQSQTVLSNEQIEELEIDSKPVQDLQLESDIKNFIEEIAKYDREEIDSNSCEKMNSQNDFEESVHNLRTKSEGDLIFSNDFDTISSVDNCFQITRKPCKTDLTKYLNCQIPSKDSLRQSEQDAWEEMNETELKIISADYSSGSEYGANDEFTNPKYNGPFYDVDICDVTSNPPDITSDSETNLGASGDVSVTTQTTQELSQTKETAEMDTKMSEVERSVSAVQNKKKKWSLGSRILSLFTRNKAAASTP